MSFETNDWLYSSKIHFCFGTYPRLPLRIFLAFLQMMRLHGTILLRPNAFHTKLWNLLDIFKLFTLFIILSIKSWPWLQHKLGGPSMPLTYRHNLRYHIVITARGKQSCFTLKLLIVVFRSVGAVLWVVFYSSCKNLACKSDHFDISSSTWSPVSLHTVTNLSALFRDPLSACVLISPIQPYFLIFNNVAHY